MELDGHDLNWALRRLPKKLKDLMSNSEEWKNKIFVGGGFLRAVVAKEEINDVDCFVSSKEDAKKLALVLTDNKEEDIIETDNAYTIEGSLPIQIIHRWVFEKPEDVANSFDFTICCAVISYNGSFMSYCDDRFYIDLAAKRLIYRNPVRNDDAGGSLIRVLKYYKKGYIIPLGSFADVIAKFHKGIDFKQLTDGVDADLEQISFVMRGLLKEVDPSHFSEE